MLVRTANVLPDGGVHATDTFVQLSVAVGGVKLTVFEHWPGAALVTTLTGQTMPGGVASPSTMTRKVQVFV
jgi:hypothetical protein